MFRMKAILNLTVILSFIINSTLLFADADVAIDKMKEECGKNSAREWSNNLNRCVDKIEAGSYRKDSMDCNKIEDLNQRKACQLNLATANTGVGSDAGDAMGGVSKLQDKSAMINTASTIISVINMFGSGDGASKCMSKNILGVTSAAGLVTDILMKIKTKRKAKELEDKYQITKNDNAFLAQYKALQYLKEEQETVKEIAEMEKKRQMLLAIGYAAAFATAAYEQFYNQGSCAEPEKKPDPKTEPSPTPSGEPSPVPSAAPSPVPSAAPSPVPSAAPSPAPVAAPSPAPVVAPSPPPVVAPSPPPVVAPSPAPAPPPPPAPAPAQEKRMAAAYDSNTHTEHHMVVDKDNNVTAVVSGNKVYPMDKPVPYVPGKVYYGHGTGIPVSIASPDIMPPYNKSSFINTPSYMPKSLYTAPPTPLRR